MVKNRLARDLEPGDVGVYEGYALLGVALLDPRAAAWPKNCECLPHVACISSLKVSLHLFPI